MQECVVCPSSYYYCKCIHQPPLCTPDKKHVKKNTIKLEGNTNVILPRVDGKAADAVSQSVSQFVSLTSGMICQSVSQSDEQDEKETAEDGDGLRVSALTGSQSCSDGAAPCSGRSGI